MTPLTVAGGFRGRPRCGRLIRGLPGGEGPLVRSWPDRRRGRSAITDLDLLGPALLGIAQVPDRADRHLFDVGRPIVPLDEYAAPASNGQAAGPLARDVVRVADHHAPSGGGRLRGVGRVPRMLPPPHAGAAPGDGGSAAHRRA